ncbi:MAG: hypothetical protein HKN04_01045 [Rhodothermaceae bacterium]|nr:hypothetical protein [Rhodothermaceae bacterium]
MCKCLIAALLLLLPASTQAQGAEASADDRLHLGLSGAVPMGEAYGGRWAAQPGVAVRAATWFHGGRIHVAFHLFENETLVEGLPGFLALRGELGWGVPLALPAGLRLTPSGQVGVLTMLFEGDEVVSEALTNETELTMGVAGRLEVPLGGAWRVFAAAEWVHVYTAVPIDLAFIQAGLSVSVSTPGWLRGML